MAMTWKRPIPSSRSAVRAALPVIAAGLAAIPLVLSRLDGDADLDPFFAILVVIALLSALAVSRAPTSRLARITGRALALAWLGAAVSAAFLLVMYQSACGCSMPDPAGLPPLPTYVGLPATAFHLLATYGGGLLVALAVFVPARSNRSDGPA